MGRVPEVPPIGLVPTGIERTDAYYRIQNLKILEQCKRYKDSLMDCQSSLKVTTDALRVANEKNERLPDYLDIIQIKVMFYKQVKFEY